LALSASGFIFEVICCVTGCSLRPSSNWRCCFWNYCRSWLNTISKFRWRESILSSNRFLQFHSNMHEDQVGTEYATKYATVHATEFSS